MMLPTVVGIVGRAGAGKDTIADYISADGTGFVKDSIAANLKEGLAVMLGVPLSLMNDRAKREEPFNHYDVSIREMLQTLGTEWGRNYVHEDIWIDLAMARAVLRGKAGLSTVFADVRFENEKRAIEKVGGLVIGVTMPGLIQMAHASESLDPEKCEICIHNDGTIEELYDKLYHIFKI